MGFLTFGLSYPVWLQEAHVVDLDESGKPCANVSVTIATCPAEYTANGQKMSYYYPGEISRLENRCIGEGDDWITAATNNLDGGRRIIIAGESVTLNHNDPSLLQRTFSEPFKYPLEAEVKDLQSIESAVDMRYGFTRIQLDLGDLTKPGICRFGFESKQGFDELRGSFIYTVEGRNELIGKYVKKMRAGGERSLPDYIAQPLHDVMVAGFIDGSFPVQGLGTKGAELRAVTLKDRHPRGLGVIYYFISNGDNFSVQLTVARN